VKGNRIIDISGAIEDYVVANGFSVVRDFVGHGIGKEMHEERRCQTIDAADKEPGWKPV